MASYQRRRRTEAHARTVPGQSLKEEGKSSVLWPESGGTRQMALAKGTCGTCGAVLMNQHEPLNQVLGSISKQETW